LKELQSGRLEWWNNGMMEEWKNGKMEEQRAEDSMKP